MGKKAKQKIIFVVVVVVLLAIIGIISGYTAYAFNYAKKWNNKIYPGVKIENIDLGGKTLEEAKKAVEEKYSKGVLEKKITVNADGKQYTLNYGKLNARYNIDETVNKAYAFGKNYSMMKRYFTIKKSSEKKYFLKFNYDKEYIDEFIKMVQQNVDKHPTDAKLEMVSPGKFKIAADVKGYKLDTVKLKKDIIKSINGKLGENLTVATKVDKVESEKTRELLESVNSKIASYSTSYYTSTPGRVNNIERATASINGTLLMPGETFSFNDTVGERTAARGYQEAGVIINNKLESGLGGGICQVSTTLYNAMLKTPIVSKERMHHSLPSHYVGLGFDATVDWGRLDYKFTNTLEYPIYIQGYNKNRVVYFNIYSNSSIKQKTYKLVNDVYATIPASTQTVKDPTLKKGEKQTVRASSDGHRVRIYRITYENGKQIDKKLLYTDFYRPIDGIVKVGTKEDPKKENKEKKDKDKDKKTDTKKDTQEDTKKNAKKTDN
ncbi:VanW family protein [Clostridium oryzae]|uniref:Vancomycin B-type resistance protein VanW n=1 Tax=Clostridium oryzae TaxID=1450648 RepID=A0A1V4IHH6_9CLOT|nr:VanW family protein [Clostridium oryzae]OPJ59379.1 vancomycin B-type resistance protein VanW [Clostridium oryzae]